MSQNVIDLAVTTFSSLLELKIQQMQSHLRGRVSEGAHKGKQASPVQYISSIKAQAPAGRFAPKQRVDATFERRWVFPIDREFDQLFDNFDELRLISDPRGQYSTIAAAAVAREQDDILIAAAFADARTGDGNTPTALSTETFASSLPGSVTPEIASTFGASAAVGLTVAKLIELKRNLRHYATDGNPDNEQTTLLIGSTQEANLLSEAQVVSTDFNSRPVLVDGNITRFMGFDFVISERLATASNVRSVIAFMKSGLYLGVWKDMANRASIRNDLSSEPWQLNTAFTVGATRLQAGKVWRVLCSDTSGASITP
jgi:hypothetical protein